MAGELRNGNVIPWTNGELIYKHSLEDKYK